MSRAMYVEQIPKNRGGQIWVRINPIEFQVNRVEKNVKRTQPKHVIRTNQIQIYSYWIESKIYVCFGFDFFLNF